MPGVTKRKQRLAALKKALTSARALNALEKARALIPDDGAGAQQVVVYGFACLLEASSAGLSILFDRFDDDELERIGSSLEAIGALQTLAAFRKLQRAFVSAVVGGRDRFDAAEWIAARPESRRIDRDAKAHSTEIEEKLLAFCKAHVEQLAA